MSYVAIAVTICIAYALGRLDRRGQFPRRREDTEATPDIKAFEGRVRVSGNGAGAERLSALG